MDAVNQMFKKTCSIDSHGIITPEMEIDESGNQCSKKKAHLINLYY